MLVISNPYMYGFGSEEDRQQEERILRMLIENLKLHVPLVGKVGLKQTCLHVVV